MAEILLLEDSPSLRRIVTRYLRDAGHGVSAHGDGTVSRNRAVLERVDVVVTDLSMPEVDGRKALCNVRLLRPELPAILMTGVERFDDPVLDTAYGYLHKPFPEEDLLDMIDAALHDRGHGRSDTESEIESRFANMPGTTTERCGAMMEPAAFFSPLSAAPSRPPASRMARIAETLARCLPWRKGI